MKQCYSSFVTQAQTQVADPMLRSRIVAAAVATAVAMSQPLPSGYVGQAGEYFTNNVMPAAMQTISDFNENLVFDTNSALQYMRQLWQLRYWSAFQQMQSISLAGSDFFGTFTGVDVVIPANVRELFDTNAKAIVSLSQFAADAILAHEAFRNSLHGE